MRSDNIKTRAATASVLGLAAGFLSGLFGVGGGILVVPALVIGLRMNQRVAHGTSLAAVLPIAVSGVIGFATESSVDWLAAAALALGALVGVLIGTSLLNSLSVHTLSLTFGGVLFVSAARLALDRSDGMGRHELGLAMLAVLVLVGLVAGTLAGLLGVGGGVVMVPAMVIVCGIPAAVAKGTSLGVIIPTSLLGTARNATKGNADLTIAAVVGIAGAVSAYAATMVAVALDESTSNALFAVFLAAVGLQMVTRRPAHAIPAAPTD